MYNGRTITHKQNQDAKKYFAPHHPSKTYKLNTVTNNGHSRNKTVKPELDKSQVGNKKESHTVPTQKVKLPRTISSLNRRIQVMTSTIQQKAEQTMTGRTAGKTLTYRMNEQPILIAKTTTVATRNSANDSLTSECWKAIVMTNEGLKNRPGGTITPTNITNPTHKPGNVSCPEE